MEMERGGNSRASKVFINVYDLVGELCLHFAIESYYFYYSALE